MPVGLSAAKASDVLDEILSGTSEYVQFHIGDPGANGTANPASETGRAQVTSWTGTGLTRASGNVLTLTSVTVSGSPETYTHASVWDAATSGNFIMSGTTTSSGAVTDGDTYQVAIGGVVLTIPAAS